MFSPSSEGSRLYNGWDALRRWRPYGVPEETDPVEALPSVLMQAARARTADDVVEIIYL